MRRGPRKLAQPKPRANEGIRASEVRLIGANDENLGVVKLRDALEQARAAELDLVEVTAKANPPVVRIADYGKYQYEQNKLKKQWAEKDRERGKKQQDELKRTQIKPGTGGNILAMRAKKIREWLDEGHKVQVDLYLFGRYKGMDGTFLKERLQAFVDTLEGEVYASEDIHKSPKGFSIVLQPKPKK